MTAGQSLATKSRWGRPSKFFPVVVDGFFDNAHAIMEYGKSLEKDDLGGDKPGMRSKQLWEINPELHNDILKRVLSIYFDLDYVDITWGLSEMSFHRNPRSGDIKEEDGNKGFIHQDAIIERKKQTGVDNEVAGLIYLTPDIDPDSGTSLWNLKPQEIIVPSGESNVNKHNAKFTEKLRFQNFFNRLIAYDAYEWHAANSYWSDGEDRLTLAFFIGGIETTSWPLDRIKTRSIKL
tara:strand:+ start:46 stop:750 length:705 start_codon:yes stop_codon:yes gene_type:complete